MQVEQVVKAGRCLKNRSIVRTLGRREDGARNAGERPVRMLCLHAIAVGGEERGAVTDRERPSEREGGIPCTDSTSS